MQERERKRREKKQVIPSCPVLETEQWEVLHKLRAVAVIEGGSGGRPG